MTASETKRIRAKLGLSQAELARLLRLKSDRTVRHWEEGTRAVSGPASVLLTLADRWPGIVARIRSI